LQGLIDFISFQLNAMKNEKKVSRPEAYPRPTQTDNQLQNQPEFIDQQPNDFDDKSISDIPGTNAARQNNAPEKETKREE
jgi:hypothetical protein